jgi:hypothetical protein
MDTILPIIEKLSDMHWFIQVVFYIGMARLFIKPIMTIVDSYVLYTPSTKDDEFWAKFKENKIVKAIIFCVDWLASIKIKK